MLSEKAKSKAQQRFFGMVRAAQKGEMDNPSSEVVDAADSMKVSDVKKFAKTKHKGLPEKKEVKEGASIIQGRRSSKKSSYRGATGDHRRDKEGNIEADFYKKKPAPTGEKWGDKSGRPKKPSPLQVRERRKKRREEKAAKKAGSVVQTKSGKKTLDKNSNYEKLKAKIYAKDEAQSKKSREHAKKNNPNYGKSHGGRKYVYTSVKKEQVNEIAPAIAMAGKALLSGGVKKAAAGAVKQKAKQAVKQKAAEVAGNVADKISKPIGGTRVQESKGTAELATLALRNKKRCAECGSFAHVTGQCPKKDHGVVNKRTITSEEKKYPYGKASKNNPRGKRDQAELDRAQAYIKKNPNFGRERGKKDQAELDRAQAYIKKNPNFGVKEAKEEEGRSDYGKASVRNKRRFGKEGKPAVIDPTNERGKMIDKRREEHQQRQVKYEGVMDIVRRYTNKKKPEKKPQKAMDAGARAKRQLARKVHAKYVSGSTENVPDDIRDHKTWSDFRKHI